MKNLKKILIKPILEFIEFVLFKITKLLLNIIGFKNASLFGGYLFKILGPFTKYNKIIKTNMESIFNNQKEIETLTLINFQQMGKTFFEFINLNNFKKNNLTIINEKYLQEIMQSKKSYIFISAHYGNWEITRNFLLDYGFELHTVYRHANNKLIDKEIQKIRKKPNAHFYKKGKESAKNMIKALKNNEYLAILIDQKDSSGSKINFLNKQAITNTGFASLALKYRTGICPIRSKRKKDGSFEIIVDKPIVFHDYENKSEVEITELIYKSHIEQWIKDDPTQWLWAHKRWS